MTSQPNTISHADSSTREANKLLEQTGIIARNIDDYDLSRKYEFVKLRLKFLGWEVDVELLEIFSGIAVWVILTDMISLWYTSSYNILYDVTFQLLPVTSWIVIAFAIGFTHFIAIMLDRSCDCVTLQICDLSNLRTRAQFKALAFMFNLAITLTLFFGHTYELVWKFMVIFTAASFWSHIRLRKQYSKLRKKQAEFAKSNEPSPD